MPKPQVVSYADRLLPAVRMHRGLVLTPQELCRCVGLLDQGWTAGEAVAHIRSPERKGDG